MTSQDHVSAGAQNEDRRFRMLVESVFDYAIYMLDPQGFVLTWNRGAERLKGYSEQEIVGEHFSRFYTEEDRASGLPERALHTAATEGRFEQEGWRVRKDDARFWAHVVIDPIRDPSGALVGFAKITRDVTADRAADQALRRSEQRFRILVQGVSDYAIYMLDPDGRVTNWNTGAIRFKGYAEDEIVGEHFSRFYTEDDRLAGLPERTLRTARTEGRFEQEGWRVRKDGARFWAHVVVDPIRDESGELIGYAKVTRDLTERREAQLALEQARASLVQAQKMEAVGQLTGGVAHDFNNLLAVILGNLDLARRRLPDGSPVSRLIENSIMAAQRGASLTKRMLAFARKQELKSEVVDVPELVSNMANLLQSSIGPNIHIETRFSLKLPPAVVDGNQLELAIVNLVVNARDAMPDGGVIVIAARTMSVNSAADAHQLAPGEYLCLSVSDAGEGMDEDTLRQAVEPFFTTKGVGKGTGLGLSMIHGFAEQSGGKLILKSAKGRGTTAEICLPLAKVAAPGVDRVDESPAAEPALPPLGILVVDDDRLVLMNTAAMLEDLGHHVLEASSGEQALQMLSHAGRLDMVITDQVMPGMSGTELAAEIRRERPDLRIVLATGYADISSIVGPELPRINKPFMQADLEKIIAATRAG